MNEFGIVTVINRPVEVVFAALHDYDKAPQWFPGLTEARQTSDGPLGVGTTLMWIGRHLGRSYESPSEHTEYVPNTRESTLSTGARAAVSSSSPNRLSSA
jgi:uncharacterized protein YndB with AHSA1/START domain